MKTKNFFLLVLCTLLSVHIKAADGDTFTAKTTEGITVTFKIISEVDRTVQVGEGIMAAAITTNPSSITIPSSVSNNGVTYSVITIGNRAFWRKSNLSSVTIPSSVTSISHYAFYGCSALASVYIPNSVTSIGTEAFRECGNLTSIDIPNSVTTIGVCAFADCGALSSIAIHASVIEIGNSAFDRTAWYKNQPNGMIYINDIAYKYKGNMPSNTSLTIREGIKSICGDAFNGCEGLKSLDIPNSVIYIGDFAFYGCEGLKSLDIPSSVTFIGPEAFSYSGLESLAIPQSVTSINYQLFYGCSSLTSVEIPNTVTSIAERAFYGCSKLGTITIPSSVTEIKAAAFYGCSDLSSVISEVQTPSTIDTYTFSGISSSCSLSVPSGTKNAYIAAGWTESVFKGGIVEVFEKKEQSMSLVSLPSMTYGAANYTLPTQTTQGLALTWASSNTSVATISGNTLTVKGAGTATITASQSGNEEYKPFSKEFALTVAKAPLTITASDATKNVGDVNPAFTASYEGFVGDDDASVLTAQPTFTTEADENSPVGTYDINVSGAEAANYEMTYVKGTLTVVDEWSMSSTLALTDVQVLRGRQVVLPVNMSNTEDITAIQFDLTLPAGVSIAKNTKGKYIVEKTERCADHTLSASKPGEANMYKVLLYSTEVESITGNEGAVINVTLEATEDMEAGDYEVRISNINLTTTAEKKITPADATCVLTVRNSIPGDANGDSSIDVTDIVAIANSILGHASESFDVAAADVNGDGSVDVTDIVVVANIILHDGGTNAVKVREAMQMLDPQ